MMIQQKTGEFELNGSLLTNNIFHYNISILIILPGNQLNH